MAEELYCQNHTELAKFYVQKYQLTEQDFVEAGTLEDLQEAEVIGPDPFDSGFGPVTHP